MALPPGRSIDLPGRGQTFIREVAGPPDAPTLMLLHGWTATADLNWFTTFELLGQHFRIIAPDHRGHGQGIRLKGSFRLEDCADDVAAIADILGINTFIPVGYSMGGTIAQLIWQRHESRVRGLVLCSTAPHFTTSREERLGFLGLTGLAALSRLTPTQTRDWLTEQIYLQRKSEGVEPWAIAQMATHDWRHILEAGSAIGNFNSLDWLPGVDVPTSVVLTTQDTVVPLERQQRLIEAIPGAQSFEVGAGHNAVYAQHEAYVPVLLEACLSVHHRSVA
ncbi:MAG: alpha/beta fold hydrolase [Actinobacteria bacterium]|nr:alpha/beta fold hydrolase [Actinomycetota bacterium]